MFSSSSARAAEVHSRKSAARSRRQAIPAVAYSSAPGEVPTATMNLRVVRTKVEQIEVEICEFTTAGSDLPTQSQQLTSPLNHSPC